MNDYLNFVLLYVSVDKSLTKIALSIEHGLNRPIGDLVESWGCQAFLDVIKDIVPLHIANHIDYIVGVDSLFDVITITDKE